MGKGLGIASFVVLLLSLPIPVVGNYLSLLAVLILCGAAYQRETTWTVVVDVIAWIKMFMLSPTWHLMMFSSGYMQGAQRFATDLGSDGLAREVMGGSTQVASGINGVALLFTVATLSAPLFILVVRKKRAASNSETMR